MNKHDLNKLKEKISNRKNDLNLTSSNVNPRNKFLTELYESVDSGKETNASVLVKRVHNLVSEKKNEKTMLPINENFDTNFNNQKQTHQPFIFSKENDMERDDDLWKEIERRNNQTLANSLEKYSQYSLNKNQQPSFPQINDDLLNQKIKGIIDNHLLESFTPIVEETIKSTIVELYAVERIKEVLKENKNLIKEIVYDVIRELQKRTKPK